MKTEKDDQNELMIMVAAPGTFLVDLTDREMWWGIKVMGSRGHSRAHVWMNDDWPWKRNEDEKPKTML